MTAKDRWIRMCSTYQLCTQVTDSAYGYPGYVPLSARVIEQTKSCIYNLEKFSKKLDCPKMDIVPR